MGRLAGRVAVVTGGGRGIGRLVAMRLAAEGAHVGVVSRSPEPLEATVKDIEAAGDTAIGVAADVCSRESVTEAFETIVARFGPVGIVVNNAQAWGSPSRHDLDPPTRPLADFDEEEWDHTYQSGLKGTLYCMLAAFPMMRDAGWGRIINFYSPAAQQSTVGFGAYTCAKEAIVGLTRTAAREWGQEGITANCISPLVVDDGQRDRMAGISDAEARENARSGLKSRIPAGQSLELGGRDVAAAVSHLASEEAAFVTGSIVEVNGGMTF